MQLTDRVVLVTGGANGIGRAICHRIAKEKPRAIVVADYDMDSSQLLADTLGVLAVHCDVSSEADVKSVVERAFQEFGQIDVVISNAGITAKGGFEAPDEDWARLWSVNLMAHVYLARATVPAMVERGGGAFIITASAAGLLAVCALSQSRLKSCVPVSGWCRNGIS